MRALLMVVTLASFLLPVEPAHSQQAWVYIRTDAGSGCQVDIPAGLHFANVVVPASHPFKGIEFKVSLPAGLVYIGEQSNFLAIGNSQTGVQIATGCQSTPPSVQVLQIQFLAPSAMNDATFTVEPMPGQTDIRVLDCNNIWMKGSNEYSIYCDEGSFLGPYNPTPADGATNVPLEPLLYFTGGANVVLLGTDPNLNELDLLCYWYGNPEDACSFPYVAGPLQPNTTYYWQALNACTGCEHGEHGASDVWSFTTGEGTVPVTPSTWGAVKALYRD